jgi:hypothetical protein
MRPAALAFYGATYGCLIALFEFLTGGIPIALSLLPLLLALGYRGRWPDYAIKLIELSASFCIAVVMMFAIKKLYAIVLLGDVDDFLGSLLHRTYGELDGRPGVEYSLMFFARIYYGFSSLVALGVPHLGPVLYAASLAALVFVTWRSRRSLGSEDRAVVWACWISLGVLSAWFGVFLNHALLHFFFMVRLLVVPIMVGAVLCAAELAARTASPGRQRATA